MTPAAPHPREECTDGRDRRLYDRIEQAVSDAFVDRADDMADAVRKALQAELPRLLPDMLCTAVREVLAEHPDLGRFGFGTEPLSPNDDFVTQVGAAFRWIMTTPDAARQVTRRGSYVLKHAAERHARIYVSNSAVVVAAALAGFRPVRSTSGPNCRFSCA